MHFTKKTVAEKRSNLIKKLQSKKLLRFPGAYNPLCAKLIAEIGFDGGLPPAAGSAITF